MKKVTIEPNWPDWCGITTEKMQDKTVDGFVNFLQQNKHRYDFYLKGLIVSYTDNDDGDYADDPYRLVFEGFRMERNTNEEMENDIGVKPSDDDKYDTVFSPRKAFLELKKKCEEYYGSPIGKIEGGDDSFCVTFSK